ncbi:MAG: hypothetical protein LBS55_08030 [Prevotellaceae bacterium]|jgi:ATP-dependent DNA helicase RecG|nr:hypothetical protein [Prevotellaceae bacterium]
MKKESQHFLADGTTWDEITVPNNVSWDAIDEETVRLFIGKAKKMYRLSSDIIDIQDLFKRLNLSKDGLLTRAALLLFSKRPVRYFPFAVCKIERFRGNSHTDLEMDDLIECPLFQMPDRIMETLIARYLQPEEYSEILLRESIMNAIVHRDYSSNTFFTIKVFDDSLELWNEGELMHPLDIESLKKPHTARLRNKLIANIFYRSGYVESWGRGTLKMLEDARAGEYKEPEFENFEGGILVRFERKLLKEETFEAKQSISDIYKIKYADDILKMIKENPMITVRKMAQDFSMSDRNVRRILMELVETKIIDRIGSKRAGTWLIINNEIE